MRNVREHATDLCVERCDVRAHNLLIKLSSSSCADLIVGGASPPGSP
jgi:hypothetical protein